MEDDQTQVPTPEPRSATRPGSDGEHEIQRRIGSTERADRFYGDQMLDHLNERMREFVGLQEMFFLATADGNGECDSTFRAGPPGFLQVLDERTLVFPEYRGNGVHASLGNIRENPHLGIMLIDFLRARIGLHINGKAQIVLDDDIRAEHPELPVESVPGRRAEMWVKVTVEEAYIHCAKHIPHLQRAPKRTARDWGTDDYKRKGGDFFGVARDRKDGVREPLTATAAAQTPQTAPPEDADGTSTGYPEAGDVRPPRPDTGVVPSQRPAPGEAQPARPAEPAERPVPASSVPTDGPPAPVAPPGAPPVPPPTPVAGAPALPPVPDAPAPPVAPPTPVSAVPLPPDTRPASPPPPAQPPAPPPYVPPLPSGGPSAGQPWAEPHSSAGPPPAAPPVPPPSPAVPPAPVPEEGQQPAAPPPLPRRSPARSRPAVTAWRSTRARQAANPPAPRPAKPIEPALPELTFTQPGPIAPESVTVPESVVIPVPPSAPVPPAAPEQAVSEPVGPTVPAGAIEPARAIEPAESAAVVEPAGGAESGLSESAEAMAAEGHQPAPPQPVLDWQREALRVLADAEARGRPCTQAEREADQDRLASVSANGDDTTFEDWFGSPAD